MKRKVFHSLQKSLRSGKAANRQRPCAQNDPARHVSQRGMFLQNIEPDKVDWSRLESFSDRTIYQTRFWLKFLETTQRAKAIVAIVREGPKTLGYFTGAVVRKFGLLILGSPFRGWTTSYMGFNLQPGVSREQALEALSVFAFKELRCFHVEVMDRRMTVDVPQRLGFSFSMFNGYEIDLTKEEDEILAAMDPDRRRCIRKAERDGVMIQEAGDLGFADDYYDQLRDVFAKQRLVPTYKKERVVALIQHVLPSGQVLLLRALSPEGHCVGTGIFPGMNDTFYFWGGASYRSEQNLHPNEAIQWHAIRYWKRRGISRYDMGGGGAYKQKYGGRKIAVPWITKSKYPWLIHGRNMIKRLIRLSQVLQGCVQSRSRPS